MPVHVYIAESASCLYLSSTCYSFVTYAGLCESAMNSLRLLSPVPLAPVAAIETVEVHKKYLAH